MKKTITLIALMMMFCFFADAHEQWSRKSYNAGDMVISIDGRIYKTLTGGFSFAPPVGGGVVCSSFSESLSVTAGEHGTTTFKIDRGLYSGNGLGYYYPCWVDAESYEAIMYDSNIGCWIYCTIGQYPDAVNLYHSSPTASFSVPSSGWITDVGIGMLESITKSSEKTVTVVWIEVCKKNTPPHHDDARKQPTSIIMIDEKCGIKYEYHITLNGENGTLVINRAD